MKKIIFTGIFIFLSAITLFWYKSKPQQDTSNLLIVGTNAEYQPFTFVRNKEIVGFDIDIATEVANRLNKKIEIRDMPFDGLLPEIMRGGVHIIAAGMTPTDKRAERMFFTKPYLSGDSLLVITKKDGPVITTVDDLRNKAVIVNEGYTADMYLSGIDGIDPVRLPTPADAFMAIKTGQADAFVAAQSTIKPFLSQQNYTNDIHTSNYKITQLDHTGDEYALAVSKKYPGLLPQIQTILDQMEQDGTLNILKNKWGF